MILVTGGAGYIGSHTLVSLLDNNHDVVVIDNLVNSSKISLERVEKLTNKKITFYQGDVRDVALLKKVFTHHQIEAVIHFAALKAVGESVEIPLDYYHCTIYGTLTLLQQMRRFDVNNFIFRLT